MEENVPAVSRLAVRLPPFWPNNPALWFAQVEASFLCAGVTADTTKFALVVSQLDHRFAAEVQDIITAPPETDSYGRLKAELIRRVSASQEERVRQVLTQEDIGDKKPSQYLRHLRSKVDACTVPDTLLRTLWSSRLPAQIKAIVASQTDTSLDAVADLADRIQDAIEPSACRSTVAACSNASMVTRADYDRLEGKVEALTTQIGELLSNQNARGRFRKRSRSRSRSSTNSSATGGAVQHDVCWYHRKFGDQAHKCTSPCSYQSNNNGSRN